MIGCFVGWLVDWLVGWMDSWMDEWFGWDGVLIGWLLLWVSWLDGCLFEWFFDWLVGWLVCLLVAFVHYFLPLLTPDYLMPLPLVSVYFLAAVSLYLSPALLPSSTRLLISSRSFILLVSPLSFTCSIRKSRWRRVDKESVFRAISSSL